MPAYASTKSKPVSQLASPCLFNCIISIHINKNYNNCTNVIITNDLVKRHPSFVPCLLFLSSRNNVQLLRLGILLLHWITTSHVANTLVTSLPGYLVSVNLLLQEAHRVSSVTTQRGFCDVIRCC